VRALLSAGAWRKVDIPWRKKAPLDLDPAGLCIGGAGLAVI